MSSFAYGLSTARRVAPDIGAADAPASTTAGTSSPLLDSLAAVVPAEALLIYTGFLVAMATTTVTVEDKPITTVTDPTLFKWGVPALAGVSAVLYVLGRLRAGSLHAWDALRLLIPAAAFICWAALQNPSAIELWVSGVSPNALRFGAVVLGVVLAAGAAALGYKADSDQE